MPNLFYAAILVITITAGLITQPAYAETPREILSSIQKEAANSPGFENFSATRGERLFKQKHSNEWSL
jgi:hypothetical protein